MPSHWGVMAYMNEAPVRPGDILGGKYQVEHVLGAGNMGLVVAAVHVDLGQRVALKLMLPGSCGHREHRERFLREARAAARLRSQHVARVLDVGTHANELPYIVMEFLEGRDLAALLDGRGPLPFAEAVEYLLQTCEAVGEAHAAGIVHRDLKPANLFLTEDVGGAPCVKVLDFGVSKFSGAALTLTQDTQVLGSPLYMSPEQMNASKHVDVRSDIWALGVILYQLVAGRTPFHSETMQELYARVLFGQPTPLDAYRSDAPPALDAVILRCLERERDRRWGNVAELAAALALHAPARARMYPDRVARVLGLQMTPVGPAAEIAVALPVAAPASWPGISLAAQPAVTTTPLPAEQTMTSRPAVTTPLPWSGPVAAPLMSGTPAAQPRAVLGSEPSLALAASQNASSSSSRVPAGGHNPPRPSGTAFARAAALVGAFGVLGIGFGVLRLVQSPGTSTAVAPSAAESLPGSAYAGASLTPPMVAPALANAREPASAAPPATEGPPQGPPSASSTASTPPPGATGSALRGPPRKAPRPPSPPVTAQPSKPRSGIY